MTLITIDRTSLRIRPYDHDDHTVVEQDSRSLALSEINLDQISFKSMLREGEDRITVAEDRDRLKSSGCILLDAQVLRTFHERSDRVLMRRLYEMKIEPPAFISFDGTVLEHPKKRKPYVLFLMFHQFVSFGIGARSLTEKWFQQSPHDALHLSAVIEK